MKRCRLWREINTLSSISSLTDRILSIFRQKRVRSDPSEMDIKVVIPAPTHKYRHKVKIKAISIIGEYLKMHLKINGNV